MGKGKLVFKGDKPAKKKKKSKKKHSAISSDGYQESASSTSSNAAPFAARVPPSPSASSSVANASASENQRVPSVEQGRGRITTSGTVLSGHGTDLKSTLRSGDAIMVTVNGQDEMRVITMVLSEISGAISSSFSSDLKSPTQFRFIRKPRDHQREKVEKERKAALDKEEGERQAFGTYGTSASARKSGVTEMVYRETTVHGSYRIRREVVEGEASRSDLLDMRSKKKSDKYC